MALVLTEEEREALAMRGFRPSPVSSAWLRDTGDGYVLLHPQYRNHTLTVTRYGGGASETHRALGLDLIPFLSWCSIEGILT